jgi:hypothetical protein
VPGSEITVSRTANRSNKSDYFVDDKKSNFKEVTSLLKEKGVDLNNNRFLILQVRPGSSSSSAVAASHAAGTWYLGADSHSNA